MTDKAVAHARVVNRNDPTYRPTRRDKWSKFCFYKLFLYFGVCYFALDSLPNTLWDPEVRRATLLIGALGIWRFGWWFIHFIRAMIYRHIVFPRMRERADELWQSGWRPHHAHFMLTTFKEHPETTRKVIESICRELAWSGVPGTIWLGSADESDELLIEDHLRLVADETDVELVVLRQDQPGKRIAIGLVLRAISRRNIDADDFIIFMDGDSILAPRLIERCASLFGNDRELQAVTTDEEVVCFGPGWVAVWLAMRFAQRRIAMQSHSLSKRVLTLTGRMSAFRAEHVTSNEFIRLVEADYIDHWLWGRFRFLSGDDKSTWYYMLRHGAKMLFVPDALIYTVERIEGSGVGRMWDNFMRWSGNMLRNGSRAIALGPFRVGPFIWWCLID
ncbi:MAG: glycosyltransferase, partial [Alphaproteobacteria bacterium]|nr:glycosyltransferase [Alphaproteobacteria bacterium]